MRKPDRNLPKTNGADIFIRGADADADEEKLPWQKRLNRKYDKDSGKIINVRLPEYYSECLQWLAEQDNRSQHGELVYLLQEAIESSIKKVLK